MANPPMIFYSRTASRLLSVLFMEPGSDANHNMEDSSFYGFSGITRGINSDASQSVTGSRSISMTTSNSQFFNLGQFNNPARSTGGTRVNFYLRFSGFPGGASNILFFSTDDGTGGGVYGLTINGSDKKIRVWDKVIAGTVATGAKQLGGDSVALSLNTWYRLSIACNIYGQGNALKAYLDGSQFASVFNHVGSAGISVSGLGPGSKLERIIFGINVNSVYFDDIYADDGQSLQDVGPIHITYKLPNANNTNNFATAIGNNPANRWENVSEQPFSDVNGWREFSVGVDENYGMQSLATGEVDLSLNNTQPSNNPAVGVRTTDSSGLNLFECGMILGYTEASAQIIAQMSYAKVSTVSGSTVYPLIWNNGSAIAINSASQGGLNLPVGTGTGRTIFNMLSRANHVEGVDWPFIFSKTSANRPMIFSGRN